MCLFTVTIPPPHSSIPRHSKDLNRDVIFGIVTSVAQTWLHLNYIIGELGIIKLHILVNVYAKSLCSLKVLYMYEFPSKSLQFSWPILYNAHSGKKSFQHSGY